MVFVYAFKNDIHIEPNTCNITWASISIHSVLATSMLLTVCNIVVKKHWVWGSKIFSYIVTILVILFYNLCIFSFYIFTLSDLVFSSIIGMSIFIFYIYVLKIDFHKSHDLRLFLTRAKIPYLVFNLFIFISVLILYFFSYDLFFTYDANKSYLFYAQAISHTNCFFDQPDNINISNDSLVLLSTFMSNFIIVLGVYLDLNYLNKNDENRWGFFNFEDDQNELQSIYTFSEEVKDAQWNNTTIGISMIRVAIAFFVLSLCYLPSYFIPNKYDNWFVLILIVKYFIPYTLYGFFLFFVLKVIYIKLNLVRIDAFKEKNNSENSSVILEEFVNY